MSDLKDLRGVRVIASDPNDGIEVTDILRHSFDVGEEHSYDARQKLGDDRVGYISDHLVVRLPQNLRERPEWRYAADLCAEVQIRTALQHAWAVMSHSLLYKRESAVPPELRRYKTDIEFAL